MLAGLLTTGEPHVPQRLATAKSLKNRSACKTVSDKVFRTEVGHAEVGLKGIARSSRTRLGMGVRLHRRSGESERAPGAVCRKHQVLTRLQAASSTSSIEHGETPCRKSLWHPTSVVRLFHPLSRSGQPVGSGHRFCKNSLIARAPACARLARAAIDVATATPASGEIFRAIRPPFRSDRLHRRLARRRRLYDFFPAPMANPKYIVARFLANVQVPPDWPRLSSRRSQLFANCQSRCTASASQIYFSWSLSRHSATFSGFSQCS